jgi:hypothetical protein
LGFSGISTCPPGAGSGSRIGATGGAAGAFFMGAARITGLPGAARPAVLRGALAFFFADLRAGAREDFAGERFAGDFEAAFLLDFFAAFADDRFAAVFLAGRLTALRDLVFFAMTVTFSGGSG